MKFRDPVEIEMEYPQEDYRRWAWSHGINLHPSPCPKCGAPQRPTIPFTLDGCIHGLEAPLHECGPDYQLQRVLAIDLWPCEYVGKEY